MKEKIIESTIKLMDSRGTRFTVDDIASELKISKKTIYKNFSSKENLASAVFSKIIADVERNQEKIFQSNLSKNKKLLNYLLGFMEIYRLSSDEIMNRFSLQETLMPILQDRIESNWNYFVKHYVSPGEDVTRKTNALKTIVFGTLKEIYNKADRIILAEECLSYIFKEI